MKRSSLDALLSKYELSADPHLAALQAMAAHKTSEPNLTDSEVVSLFKWALAQASATGFWPELLTQLNTLYPFHQTAVKWSLATAVEISAHKAHNIGYIAEYLLPELQRQPQALQQLEAYSLQQLENLKLALGQLVGYRTLANAARLFQQIDHAYPLARAFRQIGLLYASSDLRNQATLDRLFDASGSAEMLLYIIEGLNRYKLWDLAPPISNDCYTLEASQKKLDRLLDNLESLQKILEFLEKLKPFFAYFHGNAIEKVMLSICCKLLEYTPQQLDTALHYLSQPLHRSQLIQDGAPYLNLIPRKIFMADYVCMSVSGHHPQLSVAAIELSEDAKPHRSAMLLEMASSGDTDSGINPGRLGTPKVSPAIPPVACNAVAFQPVVAVSGEAQQPSPVNIIDDYFSAQRGTLMPVYQITQHASRFSKVWRQLTGVGAPTAS